MNEFDFNKLLQKYLDGDCTQEEEKLISEWYEKETQREMIELTDTQKQMTERRIWQNLESNAFGKKQMLRFIPPQ